MIIATIGLKGGTSKTTTSVHLAGEALARGHSALIVDTDVQRSALTWSDLATEGQHEAPPVIGMSTALHKQLPPIAERYEVTVIDCPPRADTLTKSALMVADLVLIPCGPSATEAWAMKGTAELCELAKVHRPDLRVFVVLTRLLPRQRLSSALRDSLADLGFPVLETTLGARTAFAEAIAAGQTVSAAAPKSQAADEIRALFDELISVAGQEVVRG